MNERIRELANTAGMWKVVHFPHLTEQEENAIQKFAELIVRECDQYVTKYWDEMEPWINPGDLLTHFGIEEGE